MEVHLYELSDFSDEEKLKILEIAVETCKRGQSKKLNKNPMARASCKIMDSMFNEIFLKVASEREETTDEEG